MPARYFIGFLVDVAHTGRARRHDSPAVQFFGTGLLAEWIRSSVGTESCTVRQSATRPGSRRTRWPGIYFDRSRHRFCFGRNSQVERHSAHHQLCLECAIDGYRSGGQYHGRRYGIRDSAQPWHERGLEQRFLVCRGPQSHRGLFQRARFADLPGKNRSNAKRAFVDCGGGLQRRRKAGPCIGNPAGREPRIRECSPRQWGWNLYPCFFVVRHRELSVFNCAGRHQWRWQAGSGGGELYRQHRHHPVGQWGWDFAARVGLGAECRGRANCRGHGRF